MQLEISNFLCTRRAGSIPRFLLQILLKVEDTVATGEGAGAGPAAPASTAASAPSSASTPTSAASEDVPGAGSAPVRPQPVVPPASAGQQCGSDRAKALRLASLVARATVGMADAGIATWYNKFFYRFWRPITAIRTFTPPAWTDPGAANATAESASGSGSGSAAAGTGAAQPIIRVPRSGARNPDWIPLGGPATNLFGPSLTPAFPSYPVRNLIAICLQPWLSR